MTSFQQMHGTKGKNRTEETKGIKSLKKPASACLALYRCATQIRDITEWNAAQGGGSL